MKHWVAALAVVAASALIGVAQAADVYPNRPIKVIVTAPPGGTIDFMARLLVVGMGRELGQSLVIDNRGGASGFIGAELVAKSPPDGYTVLLTDGAALAINSAVRTDLPVDILRDLMPVSLVATLPSILVANPSFPASNLKELVALAKQDPAKAQFASPGVGTPHHLAGVMLSKMAGIQMTHVPYKGGGPMVSEVIAGHVPLLITGALPTLPYLASGKLKALAISSKQRNPLLPNVPTFAEQGFPDFEVGVFFSFFLPSGTPPEASAALQRALAKTLADPEVRKKLEEQTLVVLGAGPEQLRTHFKNETVKWGELIRSTGVVIE
jgi:tripartite-type tricarboxylate transporter receptor subunit TctC